jgi:hypothetical protein
LDRASEDENFLKRIITSHEIRVYGCDVERKIQSSQCVGKIRRERRSAGGHVERGSHVDGFFGIEGIVHHEFLRQRQTVNRWYYLEVLKRLRENVRRKMSICGETAPCSSIMTMRQLMHHY